MSDYNINISLEFGGIYECLNDWRQDGEDYVEFHRLLFPFEGKATVSYTGTPIELSPQHAVFLPGYRAYEHTCPQSLGLYWIHFRPESLYLDVLLAQLPTPFVWSSDALKAHKDTIEGISDYFEQPSPTFNLRLQAMILGLVNEVLEANPIQLRKDALSRMEKLLPALNFMDANFVENPSLEEIANQVGLNPIYFHRRFKESFHTSPHTYMLRKRMNLARRLLNDPAQNIQSIANACGYANQFYFSRAFKQFFGASPRGLKKAGTVHP